MTTLWHCIAYYIVRLWLWLLPCSALPKEKGIGRIWWFLLPLAWSHVYRNNRE